MAQDKEAFLSRWSRRKREAEKESPPAPRDEAKGTSDDKPAEPPPGAQPRAADKPAAAPSSALPSLDKLTSESEFRDFMKPGVDDNLRRAALKKLFADPRFNVIDAMDIDIDDYTNLEKLPPEMLKNLAHAKRTLFGWDEEKKDEAGAEERPSETPPRQVADAREDGERLPARDEDDPRAQAGEGGQSGTGPDQPAKKG